MISDKNSTVRGPALCESVGFGMESGRGIWYKKFDIETGLDNKTNLVMTF